ncbi:translocase of outer mitochondrial membrane [Orbilia blumenaviensis]|uniref:Translocase of outer mitochondrial membrane n=1 Tax=Orbilia blumenaviensis TaxID=1796055 RepID=A0AAV9V2U1_9PEZI
MDKVAEDQLNWLAQNPLAMLFNDGVSSLSAKRDALELPNPGTFENVSSELTKGVFLNNLQFTGLRADIAKIFGIAPLFQVSHSFSMGLGGPGSLPPYTLATLFGTSKTFFQANLDNEGQLSARFNYRWSPKSVTRSNVQVAPGSSQAMLQLDQDYIGKDFSASIKAFNPSILDGGLTGIIIGQYLQSVTKSLSIGLEAVWQRQSMVATPEALVSYVARYQGSGWIGSAGLQAAGALQLTYWRKLAERVEAGVESVVKIAPVGPGVFGGEGLTTIGAKYDFRQSSLRAQVDTSGKLGVHLERRVAPMVTLTFSGEMDHFKSTAKVGLSVSIENASEEVMEQQQNAPSISVPF